MSIEQRGAVLNQIQRLFTAGTASGLSEWQLLRRYLLSGDDAAFESLVARHGPMVLGVCRRMLSNPDDVEDAFQATFLVLVRRARGLGERDAIGPWLYGVASRVALRARCEAARKGALEKPLPDLPAQGGDAEAVRRELGPILDDELSRLPSKYRAPIVLCYLEGETHDEAARRLGWPLGTVKGRLVRARELLKGRLVRRGLTLSAGSLVASLSREAAANVPDPLREATVRAAVKIGSGRGAAEAVGSTVTALAQGVLNAMLVNKLTAGGWVLLVCAAVALGAGAVMKSTAVHEDKNALAQAPSPTSPNPDTSRSAAPDSATAAKEQPARESTGPATATDAPAVEIAPRDEQAGKAARALLLRAFDEALAGYRDGKVDVDKVYDWSQRLRALDDAYGSRDDRRPAFQAHVDRMAQLRRQVQLRAAKGNELPLTVTAAEFYRQEAADQLKDVSSTPSSPRAAATATPALAPSVAAKATATASPPAQGSLPPQTSSGHERGKDPRSLAILAALDKPVDMQFANETPLEDVLKYIKTATKGPDSPNGLTIFVDPIGLQQAEKTMTSPVQLDLTDVPLRRTLHIMLRQLGLGYFVEEGMVYITSEGSSENGHLPNPMMTPSPLMEAKQKAARGELTSTEMQELIAKLKALRELDKLQSFKDESTAPPAKAPQ